MAGTKFSQNLRSRRVAAGFRSARDFADAVGINENRYSRYERGTSEPSLTLIAKICEILRVTPNDLLGIVSSRDANLSSAARTAPSPDASLLGGGFADAGIPIGGSSSGEHVQGEGGQAHVAPDGDEGFDILSWRFADAYVTLTSPQVRSARSKQHGIDAEHLPRVAKLFTALKSDALTVLARLLSSSEFVSASASVRAESQKAADELLAHLLRQRPSRTTRLRRQHA